MQHPDPDDAGQATSLALLRPVLFAGVWRRRFLLLFAVVIGMVVGMFRGLVMPNQYRSVGKLFVRPTVRESIAPDTVLSGTGASSRIEGVRETILTEMEVLSAPELFEKIVQRVGTDGVLAPYDPAAEDESYVPWHTRMFHTFQSWWFRSGSGWVQTDVPVEPKKLASLVLARTLMIVPEPGASVIAFSYVSHSPERARAIVNASLDAATEWHREVFETMSALADLEEEAKTKEAHAQAAEKLLRDFRIEHEVDSYETARQRLVDYIDELNKQLDRNAMETKGREAERTELAAQRSTIPDKRFQPASGPAVMNPAYSSLVTILGTLWAESYALDRKEFPSEEAKKIERERLDRQTADVEARLKQESIHLRFQPVEEENPDHVRVGQRLAEIDVDLKRLQSQRAQLLVTRDENRTRLTKIETLAPQLRALEDDLRQKRTHADGLTASVSSLRAMQRLEQLKLSNVRVMHYGTLDVDKIAPRRSQMVFYGVFGGAAVGLALVVLLTLLDRRVRVREDLSRLGVPQEGVLVSVERSSPTEAEWMLPAPLAEARDDIARFWTALPYDRRAVEGLRIAFLPCGKGANAGRAAAALAIGLASYGGERVVHVASTEGSTWLAQRLGLTGQQGWSEVLRGETKLDEAMVQTPVSGLVYLPAGATGQIVPHPMAGPAFVALLDRLAAQHRFVILELPDLEARPEGRSILGVVDAVIVVTCRDAGTKASVKEGVAAVRAAGARLLGGVVQLG